MRQEVAPEEICRARSRSEWRTGENEKNQNEAVDLTHAAINNRRVVKLRIARNDGYRNQVHCPISLYIVGKPLYSSP